MTTGPTSNPLQTNHIHPSHDATQTITSNNDITRLEQANLSNALKLTNDTTFISTYPQVLLKFNKSQVSYGGGPEPNRDKLQSPSYCLCIEGEGEGVSGGDE